MALVRQPLTGVVTIEWVDGADPDDADAPNNFGWSRAANDRPMDDRRLARLLRDVAEWLEEGADELERDANTPE